MPSWVEGRGASHGSSGGGLARVSISGIPGVSTGDDVLCGIRMSSPAMLGRMPLLPLSAAESTRSRCYHSLSIPSSVPNLAANRGGCRIFGREVTGSGKWRLLSAEKTLSAALLEDGEKTKAWEECRRLVSSLDFTAEEADSMLGKAFGWVHSPYWGEERESQLPSYEAVGETLTYLRDLGLSDDDLRKLLKKFPEVLGCGLDEEVKVNVGLLKSSWGIKGKALTKLLVRNPKVLGYNVDCKGDCIAQCTRCWARF